MVPQLKYIFLASITITIQVQALGPNGVKAGSKYKQECIYDHDCGKQMFCLNVCLCKNPNARIYIEQFDACTAKADKLCAWHEDKPCVPNASCQSGSGNSDRSCRCNSGFVPADNGTCVPSPKFGEACSLKRPCEERQGMRCHEEKQICDCMNYDIQFYDEKRGECVLHAGQNCTISNGIKLPCVSHSSCTRGLYYSNGSIIPGPQICSCDFGHIPSADGKCLPGFGENCQDDGICQENLKCYSYSITQQKCRCEFPLQQVYDLKNKICNSLVGGSCSGENGNSSANYTCIPNAECLDGICSCKSGYLATRNRRCLKGYGEDCSLENCNSERGLTCRENICQCFDSGLSFNAETKYCESGESKPCGKFLMKASNFGSNIVKDHIIHDSENDFLGPWSNELKLNCGQGLVCVENDGYFKCQRERVNAEFLI